MHVRSGGWRTLVFKNRGALLVPVALVLLVFGRPSVQSAQIGIAIAVLGELRLSLAPAAGSRSNSSGGTQQPHRVQRATSKR